MDIKGKLFVVGLPIGHIEDISLRALRTLSQVRYYCSRGYKKLSKTLSSTPITANPLKLSNKYEYTSSKNYQLS